MDGDAARILGLRALGWLAADENLFDAFLATSGADAAEVRAAADTPELLAAVFDFILQRDEWVLACAGTMGAAPGDLALARAVLGGRDTIHWT